MNFYENQRSTVSLVNGRPVWELSDGAGVATHTTWPPLPRPASTLMLGTAKTRAACGEDTLHGCCWEQWRHGPSISAPQSTGHRARDQGVLSSVVQRGNIKSEEMPTENYSAVKTSGEVLFPHNILDTTELEVKTRGYSTLQQGSFN